MKRLFYSLFALLIVVGCARTISDLVLKVGNGTDSDVKLEAELGKGVSNPYLNYNVTNDEWEFCNEGAGCEAMGSGSGGGVPLLAKGSLLTSNGTSNGEFTACADGEIIEWDAAEANGFKCVAKPSAPAGGYLLITPQIVTSGQLNTFTMATFSNVVLDVGWYAVDAISLDSTGNGQNCLSQLSADGDTDAQASLEVQLIDATLPDYSRQHVVHAVQVNSPIRVSMRGMVWYNSVAGTYDTLNLRMVESAGDGDWGGGGYNLYFCRFGIRKI